MSCVDEEALICDLAETYHIYDYKSLSCKTVAIFSSGLRDDSRIKMKLNGFEITQEQMLMAAILDNTSMITWLNTADAEKGINRPKSILKKLMNVEEKPVMSFESGEEFDKEWRKRTGKEEM